MRPPGPTIESLAARLLEKETGERPGENEIVAAAETACGKLSEHLEPLVGPTGFHTLLARALHLTKSEHPLLEGVKSGASSELWLEGLEERAQAREPAEVRDAVMTVMTEFLGLVAYFVGDDLAVRIVSRAWPDLPPETSESAFEGETA